MLPGKAGEDWGINGKSTPEDESSDEGSEAESFTVSEQGTFDELAPTEPMSPRCKSVVRRMAKHAHAKIRAERDKPSGQRRIPTLKGIYGNLLQGLPLECKVDDCKDDLWRYYDQLTNTRRLLGTSPDVAKLEAQEAEELEKDVEHMAKLKNMKSVELYYQDRRRALEKYDEKARDMLRRENARPTPRIERRAMEQLDT
ncbi:hypothetical protein GMDG_08847, partial [Pseudogymnoascus destructans 20631-21]